jgi:predicted small lipoprotein YifL
MGILLCLMMGCGQSGPLYLPDQKPPIKVPSVFASKTKAP